MNWLPALGLALVVGAPNPKEAPKKAEPPTIVGEWVCIKFVGGGQEFPDPRLSEIGFEFTADGKFRSRWGKDISEGKYSTDSTEEPAQLDFVSDKNGKKGEAIYKVEKDTLTLCFADRDGGRPTKLASPAGTRIMLLTFKRVEKKKE